MPLVKSIIGLGGLSVDWVSWNGLSVDFKSRSKKEAKKAKKNLSFSNEIKKVLF